MPYPKMLTAFGKTQSMADWSREKGVPYPLLKDRMRSGWSVEEALTRASSDGTKKVRDNASTNGKGLRRFSDWVGETVGRLTIEAYIPGRKREKIRPVFVCRCSCGTQDHRVSPYSLLYVDTTKRGSCGCLVTERVTAMNTATTQHGMARDPVYRVWGGMIQRCHNEKNAAYKHYGARGIRVCEAWRESFEAFYADMGPRPAGHTLERVDNSKGYSKDNCIWASRITQQNNRRGNRRLTALGRTQTTSEWVREFSIQRTYIEYRLRKGLTMDQIVAQIALDKSRNTL